MACVSAVFHRGKLSFHGYTVDSGSWPWRWLQEVVLREQAGRLLLQISHMMLLCAASRTAFPCVLEARFSGSVWLTAVWQGQSSKPAGIGP